jgi:hypothetical protein
MGGFYEHFNEQSGSIKAGNCLDQLNNYKLSNKDPEPHS